MTPAEGAKERWCTVSYPHQPHDTCDGTPAPSAAREPTCGYIQTPLGEFCEYGAGCYCESGLPTAREAQTPRTIERHSVRLHDPKDDRAPYPIMLPDSYGQWVRFKDYETLSRELARQQEELRLATSAGVIECMVRNPAVSEYIGSLESRLEAALAERDAAEQLRKDQVSSLLATERNLANERDAANERVRALEKALTDHNAECVASCEAQRRAGRCAGYVGRGRQCPECPRDWAIDAAMGGGK